MMEGMGSRARRRKPVRRARTAAILVGPVCLLVAGCSDGGSPDRPPDQSAVALQIRIVSGARGIDDQERAEAEQEIGDVLSAYVVRGFLGDYPREDFVQSFDAFTNGAARSAARDIDLLTAARFGDASTVTARRLTADISCLVDDGNVVGATARVSLAFEAAGEDGGFHTIKLSGRFMLVKDHATWNVFGYDVARADAPGTGQTS
jgi:hypothetical protein